MANDVVKFVGGISTGNETLTTYDEGTFTPAITFGNNAVGVTYNTRFGEYTRIGNRVFFNLRIILTSKGSSTGQVRITGLPFPVISGAQGFSTLSVFTSGVSILNAQVTAFTDPSDGAIWLSGTPVNANAAAPIAMTEVHVANTGAIYLSGFYIPA